jgi:pilus assembly protein FimV
VAQLHARSTVRDALIAPFTPRRLATLVAALCLSAPLLANAAGLGRLTVTSALGQPLHAEIEINAVGKDELGTLSARMAPVEAFNQANLDFTSSLSSLRFNVERRANGQAVVVITSIAPVNEPYIDLLLELDWSNGRLVREYTFLLDPPEMRRATPVAPVASVAPINRGAVNAPPSSSSAVASSTTSAAARPSRGAPAASTTTGGDYAVKQGDTLAGIARGHMVAGATIDQVMIATLKANPDAFLGGNINRLRSGVTLNLPDTAAATAVETSAAHRDVMAQAGDFSSYRSHLASTATSAPAPSAAPAPSQSASGKVTIKQQDNSANAAPSSDQLKLSRANPTSSSALTSNGTSTTQAKGSISAEDAAVKDRALKESAERVKMLEKNVADLQKLLELKNQGLADAQRSADAAQAQLKAAKTAAATAPAVAAVSAPPPVQAPVPAPPPAPPVPAPAPVVTAPPPVTAPPAPPPPPVAADATAATSAQPATVATDAPVAAPVVKPAPAPAPAPAEAGLFDDLFSNNYVLLGIGLVILLILAGVAAVMRMRRNKRFARFEDSILTGTSGLHANSVFGTTGGQSVDTSNSSFNSNFVPLSGQVDANEVDPVAEADVYIAYGRDAQAEEILKEALRAQPDRHAVRLKLLEIYAKRQDAKTFETVATELYAQTNGQGDDWRRAAALGASFDPANPLYREAGAPPPAMPVMASAPITPPPATPTSFERTQTIGSAGIAAAAAAGAAAGAVAAHAITSGASEGHGQSFANTLPLEPILDLDLTKTEPMPESQARAPDSAPTAMDLDFDLGFGDAAAAPAPSHPTPNDPTAATVVLNQEGSSASPLDFDLDLTPPPTATPEHERTMAMSAPILPPSDTATNFSATVPLMEAYASPPAAPAEAFDSPDIDFNLDVPPAGPTPAAAPLGGHPAGAFERTHSGIDTAIERPFGGISLDLDSGSVNAPAPASPGNGARWQEMATKLDLAIAYRDIGDKDGARELLEEVLKDGDAAQVGKARELMSALA